jgi:hypothetical protein
MQVEITHEDVWALYQKAETYELVQLAKFCTDFILSVVDSNNVWQVLLNLLNCSTTDHRNLFHLPNPPSFHF